MANNQKMDRLSEMSTANAALMTDAARMQVVQIAVDEIELHPTQPRKTVTEESIDEMVSSLEQHGQMQPIGLQAKDDGAGYYLVFGQRRWIGCKRLGWQKVASVIVKGDIEVLALVENLQREDLSPVEESKALVSLMELKGWSGKELAEYLGKHYRTVANMVGIAKKISPEILEQASTRPDIKTSHLVGLSKLTHDEQHKQWFEIKDVDRVTVQAIKENQKKDNSKRDVTGSMDSLVRSASRLQKSLKKTDSLDAQVLKELRQVQTGINREIRRLVKGSHGR